MVKLSVIVAFCNDWDEIGDTVANLLETSNGQEIEIIVSNDGSCDSGGQFKPISFTQNCVKVINNYINMGVGHAFDIASRQAKGDILVLMGADVRVKKGWYDRVVKAVQSNPNTLGCAVSVGLNETRMVMDELKCPRRYGADLLFTVGNEDLPEGSLLRNKVGGYTNLFKAKWLTHWEIPCILGAFYFTSKDYYNHIGGWDTEPNNRYVGHRNWGHLEPYISLKAWLCGGGCTLYPDIEAGHIFGRISRKDRFKKGVRSLEWDYWNQLFMLETMIMDENLRKKLYGYLHFEKNLSVAQRMIKQNYDKVLDVRERNRLKFKYTPTIFTEKFDYDFDI